MRRPFYIVIYFLIVLTSCQDNQSKEPAFVYDPTVPYPIFNSDEFWPDKFDQRGLQNAVIYHDRIFCNTIDVGGDNNFLYCFNPTNGLVVWRAQVKAHATQPVLVCDERIIYCSFLGDISTFDSLGKIIWQAEFDSPYGGHWVDTINSRLLVKTVSWNYVSIYDIKSGELVSKTENDSLQKLIDIKRTNSSLSQKNEYRFERMGKKYIIKCRQDEIGKYKIEVTNYR